MPAFSTRRTSGFATSWELLLLEREKHSKPSSSQWLPSARRNGTSTIMDARNGAMPASNTDAINGRKPTGLSTPAQSARPAIKVRDADKKRRLTDVKVRDADKKRRLADVNVRKTDQKWRARPLRSATRTRSVASRTLRSATRTKRTPLAIKQETLPS